MFICKLWQHSLDLGGEGRLELGRQLLDEGEQHGLGQRAGGLTEELIRVHQLAHVQDHLQVGRCQGLQAVTHTLLHSCTLTALPVPLALLYSYCTATALPVLLTVVPLLPCPSYWHSCTATVPPVPLTLLYCYCYWYPCTVTALRVCLSVSCDSTHLILVAKEDLSRYCPARPTDTHVPLLPCPPYWRSCTVTALLVLLTLPTLTASLHH